MLNMDWTVIFVSLIVAILAVNIYQLLIALLRRKLARKRVKEVESKYQNLLKNIDVQRKKLQKEDK